LCRRRCICAWPRGGGGRLMFAKHAKTKWTYSLPFCWRRTTVGYHLACCSQGSSYCRCSRSFTRSRTPSEKNPCSFRVALVKCQLLKVLSLLVTNHMLGVIGKGSPWKDNMSYLFLYIVQKGRNSNKCERGRASEGEKFEWRLRRQSEVPTPARTRWNDSVNVASDIALMSRSGIMLLYHAMWTISKKLIK